MEEGKYLYCVIREKEPKSFKILGQAPLEVNGLKEKCQEDKIIVASRAEANRLDVNALQKRRRKNKPLTGLEGQKVYTVNKESLALCVSNTSKQNFSFIREHLTRHQKVIEQVMRHGYDVLPVRFGTVAKSVEDIKEKILKGKRKELLEAFKTIEGRVELGLRAFWKEMPGIFQEIVAENRDIQTVKRSARGTPNQFKIAALGELIQKTLENKREKEAQKILMPLKPLAVEFKERELLRNRDVMKDSMILSSAFLVPKSKEQEFDRRVQALMEEHKKRIKFIYVGPIPPFNFVELHLQI